MENILSKPHKSSIGLITYDRKLALLHRDNIPTIVDPDKWCLIGGLAEPGETPVETFKRESFEEIGAVGKPIELDPFIREGVWRGAFVMELDDEAYTALRLGDEGQEFKFFSLDEALQIDLSDGTRQFLEQRIDLVRQFVD